MLKYIYEEAFMARFFNKNLKFIRQQKGISQKELADALRLDRSTISRWENDEMDITVSNAIQISNYFNIPIEDLTSKDLSISNDYKKFDELELLFDKNKDILTDDDKEYMKFIINKRRKEIDEQIEKGN
jgi:transcriptional regulator with XRE-family HTH domain